MIVGILKETPPETRVSLLPETVSQLTKKSIQVLVENGAGILASASDADYTNAGASISSADEIISKSDILLKIQPPQNQIPANKILIGVYQPLYHPELVSDWAQKNLRYSVWICCHEQRVRR